MSELLSREELERIKHTGDFKPARVASTALHYLDRVAELEKGWWELEEECNSLARRLDALALLGSNEEETKREAPEEAPQPTEEEQ